MPAASPYLSPSLLCYRPSSVSTHHATHDATGYTNIITILDCSFDIFCILHFAQLLIYYCHISLTIARLLLAGLLTYRDTHTSPFSFSLRFPQKYTQPPSYKPRREKLRVIVKSIGIICTFPLVTVGPPPRKSADKSSKSMWKIGKQVDAEVLLACFLVLRLVFFVYHVPLKGRKSNPLYYARWNGKQNFCFWGFRNAAPVWCYSNRERKGR